MTEELERALEAFFKGAGVDVPEADAAGVRTFALSGVELKLVCPPDESACVDCEAYVGSFAEVADKATLMEDALEANFFWEGTRGGTLGLAEGDGDDLVLSDRRDVDDLTGEGALGAWLSDFVRTVHDWRSYIANLTPAAEDGKEVPA